MSKLRCRSVGTESQPTLETCSRHLETWMFTILDQGVSLCDRLTRREWIRVGSFGAGSLSLTQLLAARTAANAANGTRASHLARGPAAAFGKAKSVILFWLTGGAPQHETWDVKPDAPPEIRGSFGSIASNTPTAVGATHVRPFLVTRSTFPFGRFGFINFFRCKLFQFKCSSSCSKQISSKVARESEKN